MRIGVAARLFFVILAACAVVVGINSIAGRIMFQRSFLGYLNEQGVGRMQEVMPRVAASYRSHGSWEFARNDPRQWFDLFRPVGISDDQLSHYAPPVSDQTGVIPRLALLDADGERVIGNPGVGADAFREPVIVDGRTVGWIAMVPFQKAIAAGDVRFYEAQLRAWWVIGTVSVLLAALLAWLLSRTLLRRLRVLAHATHRLANGDYASRINASSRDEIGQLAQDFNHLAQALEHNDRARRSFMADISHELRTPLAVMRAELEAIQDGIRPMATTSLTPLQGEVQQLGKLIDDLHDLSLTDVGALSYRLAPIDLQVVLAASVAGMQARFATAGLALDARLPDWPLPVHGDERRLHQLFANLLENALRYTDAGGSVQVSASQGGGRIRVVIEDSAPGVDADKLERLFERFYRTEQSRNRASGGSGLGLAICRNIVEAHSGSIDASPSPLGGLRITVTLREASA